MVSTSNKKDLISLLSHNCSRLLRASKCSLLLDVLLGFYDNKADIVCIAFRIIDRSGAFCVYAFKSLVTYLMYLFPAFPVVNKNNINIFSRRRFSHKSLSSLSPQVNDVTGENTFVTSALSDIVTDRLAEIDTTFKLLVQ